MQKKITKIVSVFLCALLIFQQSGFAQVAAQLDISSHLLQLRSTFVQDKFRPLHLRYLEYNPAENGFRLLLDKGDTNNLQDAAVEQATKELLRYFFVGITLPNDSFWVNLRPDSPDNIIDPALAQTDVGKILLEADLQLKKDTASYTAPQTPEGKAYWDKLYQKAGELFGSENITIPTLTRPWIVPDEIIVREAQDNAYIYKATLKVMLEQDYLKDSATYNFTDPRLKALNEYSSQLIREQIIPKITKEVNSAKRYAALRQVYYSLILAQWFKEKFAGTQGQYAQLIDSRNLASLTSKEQWSKTTYFEAYQKSFKEGEYNLKEPTYTLSGQTIRSYFSGGIAVTTETITAAKLPLPAGESVQGERSYTLEASSEGMPENFQIGIERKRDKDGRFTEEPGKSPKDMVSLLADSEYRDRPFTIEEYRTLWQERDPQRRELPQKTAYSDLDGAREKVWIEGTEAAHQYRLTPEGMAAAKMGKFRSWADNCLELAIKLSEMIESVHTIPARERKNFYAEIKKAYQDLEVLSSSGLLPLSLTDDEEEAVLHELSLRFRFNLRDIAGVNFEDTVINSRAAFSPDYPYLMGLGVIIGIFSQFKNFQRIVINQERSQASGKLRIDFDASKQAPAPIAQDTQPPKGAPKAWVRPTTRRPPNTYDMTPAVPFGAGDAAEGKAAADEVTPMQEEQEFILKDLTCEAKKGWHALPSRFLMNLLVPMLEKTGLAVTVINEQGYIVDMMGAERVFELFKKRVPFSEMSRDDREILFLFGIEPRAQFLEHNMMIAKIILTLANSLFGLTIGPTQKYSIYVSGRADKAKLQKMAELVRDYMKAIEMADNDDDAVAMTRIKGEFEDRIEEQFLPPISKEQEIAPAAASTVTTGQAGTIKGARTQPNLNFTLEEVLSEYSLIRHEYLFPISLILKRYFENGLKGRNGLDLGITESSKIIFDHLSSLGTNMHGVGYDAPEDPNCNIVKGGIKEYLSGTTKTFDFVYAQRTLARSSRGDPANLNSNDDLKKIFSLIHSRLSDNGLLIVVAEEWEAADMLSSSDICALGFKNLSVTFPRWHGLIHVFQKVEKSALSVAAASTAETGPITQNSQSPRPPDAAPAGAEKKEGAVLALGEETEQDSEEGALDGDVDIHNVVVGNTRVSDRIYWVKQSAADKRAGRAFVVCVRKDIDLDFDLRDNRWHILRYICCACRYG